MATIIASISSTPALSAEGGGRDICLDSSGRLWAVYSKIPAGLIRQQIYVAYSDDNGATWTEERVTTGYDGYHHFFPAIAADGFNAIHIVYQSSGRAPFPTRYGVFYRRRTIGGWDAEETVALLDVANPGQDYPTICVDTPGDVYIAWDGLGWGANPGVKNIKFRSKVAGVWQVVESVTDMAQAQMCVSMGMDSFGGVHLAWEGTGWGSFPAKKQIAYGHGPTAWITENVTDENQGHYYGRIAIDSSNKPHVVYTDDGFHTWYMNKTGILWSAKEQVSSDAISSSMYPTISLDKAGSVHAAWSCYGGGLSDSYLNLWYNKRQGSVWLGAVPITNAMGTTNVFALASDGTYIYAALYASPNQVVKIDAATMTEVARWVPAPADLPFYITCLTCAGGYVYAGLNTGSSQDRVVKIDAATMTKVSEWTGAAGENDIQALASVGGYVYAGINPSAGRVVKIDPATMATVLEWMGTPAQSHLKALLTVGPYIYVGLNRSPGEVVQVRTDTMATVAHWVGGVGETYVVSLTWDGSYVYAGLEVAPGQVIQIDPAAMTEHAKWTGVAGENDAMGLASDGTDIYGGLSTSPGQVVKINPATMAKVSKWTGAAGEDNVSALALDGSGYIHAGLQGPPGGVIKIDPAAMSTVLEWMTESLSDQQNVSSLWAFYPVVGGQHLDVLNNKMWLVWEDYEAHIMFAEAPAYPPPPGGGPKSQAHFVG